MIADADGRARIRGALDVTLVVEAAAGTGKTTELIKRMVAILRSGRTTLGRIVGVTFTDRAAGEMKLRLRAALEEGRNAADTPAPERARFEAALSELETAHIGTIHGFCGDLLRERPVEAGVDPLYDVGAEDEAGRLFEAAFERWLGQTLENPPQGVRRVLRRSGKWIGPRQSLRNAAATLREQRDFDSAWSRPALDRDALIDELIEALTSLGQLSLLAARPRDNLAADLSKLMAFADEVAANESVWGQRDYDLLEVRLGDLVRERIWKRKGSGQWFGEGLLRADVVSRRDLLFARLEAATVDMEADLAAALREDLRPVVDAYQDAKRRTGTLDFLDLLIRARDLLKSDADVRRQLQRRYTHIFVDEFQDTDPLQAEILLLLGAEPDDAPVDRRDAGPLEMRVVPGKLFLVGDPKQSIYRFRRADVTLYARIKESLLAQGAELVVLTTSFRAVPMIQRTINAAFAEAMQARDDGSQAQYHALSPFRDDRSTQPSVVALPVPRPYGQWGSLTNGAIAESTPDAVGAFVDHLVHDSGWVVNEDGKDVPIEARHVCLLFRRLRGYGEDAARPYVRALEARRVPHVLVGGHSFHTREEVTAIRTALTAIEWPDDGLTTFATLRGPLISLGDAELLDYRQHVGPLNPMHRPDGDNLTEPQQQVRDALDLLRSLHLGRNRQPIGDTISELLRATRAHAGIAIWPTGEQALANVLRIADRARRFEGRGATSFRAFVEHIVDEAERGDIGETPVLEEGVDGVRIMTVHAAKGLEFPVVVLCEPSVRFGTRPSHHVDTEQRLWACRLAGCAPAELRDNEALILQQEQDEEVRVTYVAATRARDLLVVPCVGDQPRAGWVDVMHTALYPAVSDRRNPSPGPGCPAFGHDSVRDAPARAQRRVEDSVAPGLHRFTDHEVVWWDPSLLDLDREPLGGIRQQQLLAAEGLTGPDTGAEEHGAWSKRRTDALQRGARASFQSRPMTALAEQDGEPEAEPEAEPDAELQGDASTAPPPVEIEHTASPRAARPAGKRFGTLTHAVLADAMLDGGPVEALSRWHGKTLGAPDDEIAAAADAATLALAHPLLKRAKQSRRCHLEAPISRAEAEASFAEGVIDLAFLDRDDEGPIWTVVDFKTDDPGEHPEYARQVALYAKALARATGQRARGVLLGV